MSNDFARRAAWCAFSCVVSKPSMSSIYGWALKPSSSNNWIMGWRTWVKTLGAMESPKGITVHLKYWLSNLIQMWEARFSDSGMW